MPFEIVRNDITKMRVDAIVNAANNSLLGGGGVDGAIHRAAGPSLLAECRRLHGCDTGDAKITGAGRLPCRYVIHTVGPVWRGGGHGERRMLVSCYRKSLQLAVDNGCESVAFPLISAGVYGYPAEQAIQVATETIRAFLQDHELMVYLVIFDRKSFQLSSQLYQEIVAYIDDNYVNVQRARDTYRSVPAEQSARYPRPEQPSDKRVPDTFPAAPMAAPMAAPPAPAAGISKDLLRALDSLDESFSQMLMRKIDQSGMTDAQCYKKANISRKLFSKIRSDLHYRPSKPTVLAFAVALELPLNETQDLLRKAGFALSHSNQFDVIVEYFIAHGIYDIYRINEALFAFDQSLLGG